MTQPTWQVSSLDEAPTPTLSDFQGKPTLLLFFNLGCLGCMHRGVPLARELAKVYPELNVVGVHSNFGRQYTPEEVTAALEENKVDFPVLQDDGHTTYTAFKAEGTPHWILLDENGEINKSIFGSQPNAQQRLTYGMMELFGD